MVVPTMDPPDHRVKSVATAFRIIDALQQHQALGVTDVAQETGIAKSSVFKHLDTLRYLGYVVKDGEKYTLSLRWYQAGRTVRDGHEVLDAARTELDRLAQRTGETVSLVVEENGNAWYLYQVSQQPSPTAPTEEGRSIPAPLSVGGKAVYSYRPDEESRALLSENDVVDGADQFLAELRDLRDQRIVVERDSPRHGAFSAGSFEGHRHVVGQDEPYHQLHSAAVPIRNTDNYGIAAIEVSGPEGSLHERRLDDEIVGLLVNAGKAVETNLLDDHG